MQHHRQLRSVLLTGVTGFVGQAVLERLLRNTDATLHVIIRSRGKRTAAERLDALTKSACFGPWRAEAGDDTVNRVVRQRVHVIDSDLTTLQEVPGVDTVIHSASAVDFYAKLDSAMESNVHATDMLYRAVAAASSSPRVVHVSSAYVNAHRRGLVHEEPVAHSMSWRTELAHSRQTALDLIADGVIGGAYDDAMRQLGLQRTKLHKLADTYTMSKILGEQVAEEYWGGGELAIIRPTTIEPAISLPYPGWIDGYKVMEPLIAEYAKGRMPIFAGSASEILDVVPVDIVVTAVVAAATTSQSSSSTRYMHVGTGASNPITAGTWTGLMSDYFTENPWQGKPVKPIRLVSRRIMRASLHTAQAALTVAAVVTPKAGPLRKMGNRTRALRKSVRRLLLLDAMYSPFSSCPAIFDDANTRELIGPEAAAVDWPTYVLEIHLPTVERLMRDRLAQKAKAKAKAQPKHIDLTDNATVDAEGPGSLA